MRKRTSVLSMQKAEAEAAGGSRVGPQRSPSSSLSHSSALPLLAALYYIATAVSLTLFNKLLFARFPASHPPFLLLCQSLTAAALLSVLRLAGLLDAPPPAFWARANLRVYAPLYVSNLTMLLTSLIALKFTSLLMYNTLRRTSMIFVVALHSVLHRTKPSAYTVGATALVTLGALVASRTDLAFDPVGYGLAFTANLSTAVYLVLLRPVRDKLGLSNLQLIYVNALTNIPVLGLVVAVWPPGAGGLVGFAQPAFAVLFLCSCSLAVVINHAIFVNTTTNDAIAQSISSQLKDVVLLVTSIVFVDDPKQRASGNLQGVVIGFLGSLVYGVGKVMERRMAQEEDETVGEEENAGGEVSVEKVGLMLAEVKTSAGQT